MRAESESGKYTAFFKSAPTGASVPVSIEADVAGRGLVIGAQGFEAAGGAVNGLQFNSTATGGNVNAYTNTLTAALGVLDLNASVVESNAPTKIYAPLTVEGDATSTATAYFKAPAAGVNFPIVAAADVAGRGMVLGAAGTSPSNFAFPGFAFNTYASGGIIEAYTNINTAALGVLRVNASRFRYDVVPSDYADNAAAVAAGLVNGDVYRTGDVLKVVHP